MGRIFYIDGDSYLILILNYTSNKEMRRLMTIIVVMLCFICFIQAQECSNNTILDACCLTKDASQCGKGSCSSFYYSDNLPIKSCLPCDLNCKRCDKSGCIECSTPAFSLVNKRCISSNQTCNISNCQQCLQNFGCLICKSGYIPTVNKTCRQIDCSNKQVCCPLVNSSECGSGICSASYFSSSANLCLPCVNFDINCKTCTNLTCLSCYEGFAISSNSSCKNITTPCNLTNCAKCSQLGCSLCNQGFVLNFINFTCTKATCSVSNCSVCSQSTCMVCSTGYLLANNTCEPICSPLCKTCLSPGKCNQCINQSTLNPSSNICQINCTVGFGGNCDECQSLTYCKRCKSGYQLAYQNTVCEKAQNCSISNCKYCRNQSCLMCDLGYKLLSNSSCSSDICYIPFCKKCSSVSRCESCADNYELSLNSTICIPSCKISKCSVCQNQTYCSICDPGYNLDNNSCSKLCKIDDCSVCLSQNTCLICSAGRTVSTDGKSCKIVCKDQSCSSCLNSTICQACILGYNLNSKGECKRDCMFGFAPNENKTCKKCSSYSSYCQDCFFDNSSTTIKCISCLVGSFLDSGSCSLCNSTLDNCVTCSSASQCTICRFGYQLSSGICSLKNCSAPNCELCKTNSTLLCSSCSAGFTANSLGVCVFNCENGKKLLQGVCKCPLGTYESSSSCKACSDSYCINCTDSSCLVCRKGYFASGLSCQRCIDNCYVCIDSSSCSICQPPYIYSNGSCSNAGNGFKGTADNVGKIFSCPAGCDSCSLGSNNILVCESLASGYSQIQGNIIKCAKTCLTCSEKDTCLSCYPGYTLSGDKCLNCTDLYAVSCSDANTNFSLTCVSGYTVVYSNQTSKCGKCAANCYKCDINGANTCDSGQCSIGFVQLLGTQNCTACFSNCPSCSQSDPSVCLSCGLRRYKNANGKCTSCPSGCKECSSDVNCTSCYKSYVLVNNLCQLGPLWPCSKGTNLKCTDCVDQFTLNNSLCVYNSTCNTTSSCTSCAYGYYLVALEGVSSGKCYTCPEIMNCLSCEAANSSSCLMCKSGFYVQSGVCTLCQSGCWQCSSNYYCSQAKEGYYLLTNSDGTYSGQLGNCSSPCKTCDINPNFCLSCQSGYSINGSTCFSNKVIYYSMTFNMPSLFNKDDTFSQAYGKVLKNIGYLKSIICKNLPQKIASDEQTCEQNFKFLQFKQGSIQYESAINGGSYSSSSEAQADISSSNLIPNAQVISTSSRMEGYAESNQKESKLGLVIGLTVGISVLLVAVASFIIYRRYKSKGKEYVHRSESDCYDGSQDKLPNQ